MPLEVPHVRSEALSLFLYSNIRKTIKTMSEQLISNRELQKTISHDMLKMIQDYNELSFKRFFNTITVEENNKLNDLTSKVGEFYDKFPTSPETVKEFFIFKEFTNAVYKLRKGIIKDIKIETL
jgi:hypothetical protein